MIGVSPARALVLLTGGALICFAAACSSSSTTSTESTVDGGVGSGSDASSSGATDSGAADSAKATSDSGGGGVTPADQACGQMADGGACIECCDEGHKSGAETFYDSLDTCYCGPQGHCQTQCAQTDCSQSDDAGFPTPGDPCDLCEQQAAPDDGGGVCGPQITSACNANSDCNALLNCYNLCP